MASMVLHRRDISSTKLRHISPFSRLNTRHPSPNNIPDSRGKSRPTPPILPHPTPLVNLACQAKLIVAWEPLSLVVEAGPISARNLVVVALLVLSVEV